MAAVPKGRTYMGKAFELAASVLGKDDMPRRAFNPALVLITDGMATDDPAELDAGLHALMSKPAGRDALRMAVAIGRDARSEALTKFIADPKVPVLVADKVDQIADQLRLVTLAVTGVRSLAEEADERGTPADDLDIPV